MNADLIPDIPEGKKMLMLYVGKGSQMNESEAISNYIDVEAGVNYTFSLNLFLKANASNVPLFNLVVEDEHGAYNIYSSNETTARWKNIEFPIVFRGNKMRYKLYGRVYTGGVFIDNILLYKEQGMANVKEPNDTMSSIIEFTRLDGIRFTTHNNGDNPLPIGMYIVRRGKEMRKVIVR